MSFALQLHSWIGFAAGLGFTWLGYRPSAARASRAIRCYRIIGPAILSLAAFSTIPPDSFPLCWERFGVDSGRASAEFPGSPLEQSVTDTTGPVSTARKTLLLDLPDQELSLRLSISPMPVESATTTDAQRIAATAASFKEQGFTLLRRSVTATPGATVYRLELRWDARKMTTHVLLAYTGGKVYRAMATVADSDLHRGIDERFLNSFRVERAVPREPASGPNIHYPYDGAFAGVLPVRWLTATQR